MSEAKSGANLAALYPHFAALMRATRLTQRLGDDEQDEQTKRLHVVPEA